MSQDDAKLKKSCGASDWILQMPAFFATPETEIFNKGTWI